MNLSAQNAPHQLAEFCYLQKLLEERCAEEEDRAWLWKARLRILTFLIQRLEESAEGNACLPDELDAATQHRLRKSHRMLQNDPGQPVTPTPAGSWTIEARRRVEHYLSKRKSSEDSDAPA